MVYERDVLPVWAGNRQTFMRVPFSEIEDLKEGVFAVVGIPHETTCGTRPGPKYGPQAIRQSSTRFDYYLRSSADKEIVDIRTGKRMRYPEELKLADLGDVNLYPTDIQKTTESIKSAIFEIVSKGAFPISLGGDHYVTYPLFMGFSEGLRKKTGAKKIGLIHFDGHLDATDDNPVYGKYFHGTILPRIAELDMIEPSNIVAVGINGTTRKEQWEFVKQNGVHMFTTYDIREKGIQEITKQAIDLAGDGCDSIYLTLDIDVVDCAYAPGTGAVNIGGISHVEFLEAINILKYSDVGAMDVVEVSPLYDPAGMTQRLAATAIFNFIAPKLFYI